MLNLFRKPKPNPAWKNATEITKEMTEEIIAKIRKEHNISKLIEKDGFHLKYSGRAGTIYYVVNGQAFEIDVEMCPGPEADYFIWTRNGKKWGYPEYKEMSEDEYNLMKSEFQKWIMKRKLKVKGNL